MSDLSGLSDRIADALRDVRLLLGEGATGLAQMGHPIALSGTERDDIAAAIAPIVAEATADAWDRAVADVLRFMAAHGVVQAQVGPNPYRMIEGRNAG